MKQIMIIYFSATGTPGCCVDGICKGLGFKSTEFPINLADNIHAEILSFQTDDIMVVATMVYGGRDKLLTERISTER